MHEETIQPYARLQLRRLVPTLPYAAVIVGLYFLDSAWVDYSSFFVGID